MPMWCGIPKDNFYMASLLDMRSSIIFTWYILYNQPIIDYYYKW